MALAKKDAKDMTGNDEAQKDEYGFYMAPIDETTGSAEFMNPKQFCRKIYDWVSGSSTGTLSTCVNELNIPGHLMPQTTSSDLTSSNVTEAMCNSLGESTCYGTSGCAFQNNICFSAVTNEHCDNYSTEKKCNADKADACYWGTPNNGTEPQCMLRLQYCGQYTDAEQCVDVDGCMWYNDLQNGQSGGPSDSSHRGRCMADMCARINNGRCTIQHTGGRCVWYTKEQNLAYRGKDFPGCYLSPCNNRFTKDSCSSASETDPYYDCVWCKNYPDTILGCQNAKTGSLAQCWNVQDSNPEAYPIQGSGCTRCMGELTADGICKGTQRNPNACFEKCCASSACTCFSGDLTSFTDGTTTSG